MQSKTVAIMTKALDLIAFASDPAFALGEDRRILAWNRAAEELLGYRADEVVGLPCAAVVGAVLRDGGSVCSDNCEGFGGLHSCRGYSVSRCFAAHKDGRRVQVALSSIVIPEPDRVRDGPIALVLLHRQGDGADSSPADPRLKIQTFGRFALTLGDVPLPLRQWTRRHAVQLLKLLVMHLGRPLDREQLIEQLWPDVEVESGRARLKVTVHFLRQQLRRAGLVQDVVATEDSAYILRADRVWVDRWAFENCIRGGRASLQAGNRDDAARSFEEARALYRGEFMEADRYEDWCTEERERLREMYLDALTCLADLYASHGQHERAVEACQAALVREPCREMLHQRLISAWLALERPERALAQYHRCAELLRQELGAAPARETVALVRGLLHDRPRRPGRGNRDERITSN